MKKLEEKLKAKDNCNKDNLEDFFLEWVSSKPVSQFKCMSSLVVTNMWWAHNSNLFRICSPKTTIDIT
jgi:hypothetical protein